MEQRDFFIKESTLSPEKEAKYLAQIQKLTVEKKDLADENALLKEQLAWLKKQVYGQKSEKSEVVLKEDVDDGAQINLFNEAEVEADPGAVRTVTVSEHKRKAKRTHDALMSDLPKEEVIIPVEDKICKKCGAEMEVIGKEHVRDELVYVPAKLYVRQIYVETAKCTNCGKDESRDASLPDVEKNNIVKAKAPEAYIPHSFCTPELLSHIMYEKYCNAVPLYRLEKDFAAKGAVISRATMANWIIYEAEQRLRPVWERMRSELLKSHVIHADETVVQVLKEPGRKATADSRMWCYCNGKINDKSVILFEYTPTRNGANAEKFLTDFDGYLVCDGYDGYNKLKRARRCGCFAHVRRKFVDALPKEKALIPTSVSARAIEYCNALFELEREFEKLSTEDRRKQRQERSLPILDDFFAWLDTIIVSGQSNLAKAVNYTRNEKKYLYRFLEDGDVPISNNRAENAIRPFCVGRKNWLFSASVGGARASAMIYSIVSTACANGFKIEDFLTRLLTADTKALPMPWVE